QPFPDFPYQAVVKDSSRKPIAFGRFELPESGSAPFVIPLDWRKTTFPDVVRTSHPRVGRSASVRHTKNHIFIFWIDGGSWWFVRPGAEMGLLPNFSDLIQNGSYAEMSSVPAFTSIAIKRITSFDSGPPTFFDLLTLQLKGIQSLDRWMPKIISSRNSLS